MALTKIQINREQRKRKVRSKIKSSASGKLRLSVFRSGKHFYAMLVDTDKGRTLLSVSDLNFLKNKKIKEKLSLTTLKMGKEFGKKMLAQGIKEAAFDRSFYKFHGLVKSFAQGVKDAGVKI